MSSLYVILAVILSSCTVPVEHKVTAPQVDKALNWLENRNKGNKCQQLAKTPENMSIKVVGEHFDMRYTDVAGLQFMQQYGDVRQCQIGQSTIVK